MDGNSKPLKNSAVSRQATPSLSTKRPRKPLRFQRFRMSEPPHPLQQGCNRRQMKSSVRERWRGRISARGAGGKAAQPNGQNGETDDILVTPAFFLQEPYLYAFIFGVRCSYFVGRHSPVSILALNLRHR